jgi:hypothetical protein
MIYNVYILTIYVFSPPSSGIPRICFPEKWPRQGLVAFLHYTQREIADTLDDVMALMT